MKKSKNPIPKEFPTNLVEDYTSICERLKKHETALIKRFAPKLSEILIDFIRLANVFKETEMDEYAALCYQGAARCEKLHHNFLVERHWLLKAANSFTSAYNRRLELGYPDGDEEFRQGALRCFNDLLTNPKLPEDSPLRAAIIRQLKKIDPHSEQTSSFESPAHRYEDLSLAANVDISEENYQGALSKLTDIYEDIHERKVEQFYEHVLERIEILRLLLMLYLNMPPATLAPCNVALLDLYTMKFEGRLVDRCKDSFLDPDLHFKFRAFYQSIKLRDVDLLRDAFNDVATLLYLTPEQIKLINLVFDKYDYQFQIERGEEECRCFQSDSSEEEGDEEKPSTSEAETSSGTPTESKEKEEVAEEKPSTSKESASQSPIDSKKAEETENAKIEADLKVMQLND